MVSAESVQMSREFFENPGSYAQFTQTADHRGIVGCIEPRDEESTPHGEYKTVMQTSGGAVGEGLDAALALTVIGDKTVAIGTGMDIDKNRRPVTVFGAHHRCKFVGALDAVVAEMAEPSSFTLDSVEGWARVFNQWEHVRDTLGSVMDAANVQLEYLREQDHMDNLVEHADQLYPEHKNVAHVRGDNIARVYVVGMHRNVGKNRNAKPTDIETASKIQGYHDSLAATVHNLRGEDRVTNEIRGLRLTSMILRAAAARTVITRDIMPEMTFYEVHPSDDTRSGLKIIEQQINQAA